MATECLVLALVRASLDHEIRLDLVSLVVCGADHHLV
jgi:hypothetical protein